MRHISLLNFLLRRSYNFFRKRGFSLVPIAYDDPLPHLEEIPDAFWQRRSSLIGIEIDAQQQKEFLSMISTRFKPEYDSFSLTQPDEDGFFLANGMFTHVDAQVYYSIIRQFQPKNIIEIGAGYSTLLAAKAIRRNIEEGRDSCNFITIEPSPASILQRKSLSDFVKVINSTAQEVPLDLFMQLAEGDILFVDSTHVLKTGSDVQYILLEIIPRLKKGVLIHFHDIFFPAEYPRQWLEKYRRFFNEQYALEAFLLFNDSFKIIWAGSYMHLNYPQALEAAFSSYQREDAWPASLWIRRVK